MDKMSVFKYKNGIEILGYSMSNFINEYEKTFNKTDGKQIWKQIKSEIEKKPLGKRFKDIELNDGIVVFSNGFTSEEHQKRLGYIIDENKLSFSLLTDDKLKNKLNQTVNYPIKREFVKEIENYLTNSYPTKICCIYGLRRTGKTVSMIQLMKELLNNNQKVAFINCNKNTDYKQLYATISDLGKKQIKYLFIDEITYMKDFIDVANQLSDIYASSMKIIISGTDSFILNIAQNSILFDRMIKVNTTYISFTEYKKILGNNVSFLDYIKFGGTFNTKEFITNESTNQYIETSIIQNIENTIEHIDSDYQYDKLVLLHDNKALAKAIMQTVLNENKSLAIDVINSAYKAGDLRLAIKNLKPDKYTELDRNIIKQEISKLLNYNDLYDIKTNVGEDGVIQLKQFLECIHVLYSYEKIDNDTEINTYLFNMSGMRYNQVSTIIQALVKDKNFQNICKERQDKLIEKLKETVEGFLIEYSVLNHTLRFAKKKNYKVTQIDHLNEDIRKEYDMILDDNTGLHLYEVKRKYDIDFDNQCRWLNDKEMNTYVENKFYKKIKSKNVLYLGNTTKVNDINYINIEEFLDKISKT